MNKTWLLAAISCVCFVAYADEKKGDEPPIERIEVKGQRIFFQTEGAYSLTRYSHLGVPLVDSDFRSPDNNRPEDDCASNSSGVAGNPIVISSGLKVETAIDFIG